MLARAAFARDFTSKVIEKLRLRWSEAVNDADDIQALGQLIDKINGTDDGAAITAYLGALELVKHGKSEFLVASLKRGGILALRRLFKNVEPLQKTWNGMGPGLGVLAALIDSSILVRNCLLDHWAAILRPIAFAFGTIEKVAVFDKYDYTLYADVTRHRRDHNERIDAFCSQIVPHMIDDPRVILNGQQGVTFSDYLRNLELQFMVAPDSTPESVARVSNLNLSINPHHICLRHIPCDELWTNQDDLPGPRLGFANLTDRHGLRSMKVCESMEGDLALKAQWDLNALTLSSILDLAVSAIREELQSVSIHQRMTERKPRETETMKSMIIKEVEMAPYVPRAPTIFRFATSTDKLPETYASTDQVTEKPDQSTNNIVDRDLVSIADEILAPNKSENNATTKKSVKKIKVGLRGPTVVNLPIDGLLETVDKDASKSCDCKPGGVNITLKAQIRNRRKQYARQFQNRLLESETVAHCSKAPRHLKHDPRQSRRFRKAVKPLLNSLSLPESQKEAAQIVFRGYDTICRFSKAAVATGDLTALSSVTKHCFIKGLNSD